MTCKLDLKGGAVYQMQRKWKRLNHGISLMTLKLNKASGESLLPQNCLKSFLSDRV